MMDTSMEDLDKEKDRLEALLDIVYHKRNIPAIKVQVQLGNI